jgi:hypothetical protein
LGLTFSLCRSSLPAAAFLPPDFWLQKNRTSQLLPEEARLEAVAIASKMPITITPEEFERQLAAQATPGSQSSSLVYRFYASMNFLERRETVLEAYQPRQKQLEKIDQALREYISRAQARLRAEDRTDQYHIEQLPASEFKGQPVQLEVKPEGLQTRQWLPWPESLRQGLVQEAQLRAEQELEYNQAALKVIGGAEKDFDNSQAVWNRHLKRMTDKLQQRTDQVLRTEMRGENTTVPVP